MFKPVTAGLMCLGLATLGVTMLRGEVAVEKEEVKADVLFYKADVEEIGAEAELTETITEGVVGFVHDVDVDVADLHTEIGEINITGLPEGQGVKERLVVNFAHPAGVVDAATRETLEKLVKQLREEEAKLRGGQRNEEADQKAQSAATLEMVLKGHGPFTKIAGVRTGGGPLHAIRVPPFAAKIHAEQAELQSKIAELHAKRAKIQLEKPDSPEVAELEKAILDLKKSMDERMNHIRVVHEKLAGVPGAAHAAHVHQIHTGPWQKRMIVTGGLEADSLKQKGDALLRAAEVLSSAGLDDKARELREKADKVLAEAKQQAARAHAEVRFTHAGGPPAELHQALNELREQVQQLRKEVGELRSLLEKKQ